MITDPLLESFDAARAEPLLDQLISVYVEIYAEPEDAFHGGQRYRQQITSHMKAPGWKLVTATNGTDLTGYRLRALPAVCLTMVGGSPDAGAGRVH